MDDNFFEYLYVTGELNKDDSLGNSNINELYNQYYGLFPNDPIDNEFFFNSQEEQIRLLEEAINNGEPIKKRGK